MNFSIIVNICVFIFSDFSMEFSYKMIGMLVASSCHCEHVDAFLRLLCVLEMFVENFPGFVGFFFLFLFCTRKTPKSSGNNHE